jgi:hypothetical protein
LPLGAAAEYYHSSQSSGRLRRRSHRSFEPCRYADCVQLHRAPPPVAWRPLAVASHPATTRRAPRRTLADGVAHRPRHHRFTSRSPRIEDTARLAPRRADRSLLDPRKAWPAVHRVGRSPFGTREADPARAARPRSRHAPSARSVTPCGRNRHDACRADPINPCDRGRHGADGAQSESAREPKPASAHSDRAGEALSPGLPGPHTTCSIRSRDRSRARSSLPRRLEIACSRSRPDEATRRAVLDTRSRAVRSPDGPLSDGFSRSPSEDRVLDRDRRPKTAVPRDAGPTGTSPICACGANPPARDCRPLGRSLAVPGAGTHRPTVATRAGLPRETDPRPSPGRSRATRPAVVRLHCKQRSRASTGQANRGEHPYVFACTSPNNEGCRPLAPRERGYEADRLAPVDRRRLPGVRLPSSGIRCADRFAPVYLTDAIRSQRFSRSQRFFPDTPSWPYFVPHPLVGFRNDLQSFSRTGQPWRFSAPAALLPLAPAASTNRYVRRTRPPGSATQHAAPRNQ